MEGISDLRTKKENGHHQKCYLEDNLEEWEENGRQEADKLSVGCDVCVPLDSRKELDEKGEYSIHLVVLAVRFGQKGIGIESGFIAFRTARIKHIGLILNVESTVSIRL